MMTTAAKELNRYVGMLSEEEQEELAKALRKKLLIAKANRLSKKRKQETIPISEIVKEVHIVRKLRHVRQGSN
jgi:Tfp pilus assembly pilus retraction ATPase PilT